MKVTGPKVGEFFGALLIAIVVLVVVRGMWLSLWNSFVP